MAPGTISLSVVSGAMSGLVGVFDIKKRVTVGRLRANKFQIKSDTVSSKHAIIEYVDGRWVITDCKSSNGTVVNGMSVIPGTPVELKDGDMILVGAGSDNVVRVNIEIAGRVDVHVEEEVQAKTSGLSTLTIKQWMDQEKERLTAECEAAKEAALKELAESAAELEYFDGVLDSFMAFYGGLANNWWKRMSFHIPAA